MRSTEPDSNENDADSLSDSLALAEVKYSLPELLAELKLERTTGTFAMERLNQMEIGKLFQNKQRRRAKPKS
ncbi:MAG TPA: hypothetical protein PLN52_13790 [Opitutaceae bacterium]|nr:hypothetical protein [Opitutaceae bacterium]